jgi:transcription antitermination factor NusG
MEVKQQWYAVYTKPRWEKKVAELLKRKRIENFCPLNKVLKQWADRRKVVEEPLFTSYVFVYGSAADLTSIKQTDGVLNFVYWLGRPAVIRDQEIEAIKDFLTVHRNVQVEKISVNVNDQIRILSGPLRSREGEILEVMNKTVKVFLPSLGYAMCAEVEKANVEIISMNKNYLHNPYQNAAVS